jgi:hypothetical protein
MQHDNDRFAIADMLELARKAEPTVDRKTVAEANLQLSSWYDECIEAGADPIAICTAMVSTGVNLGLLNQPGPYGAEIWANWLRKLAASVEAGTEFPPIGHSDFAASALNSRRRS